MRTMLRSRKLKLKVTLTLVDSLLIFIALAYSRYAATVTSHPSAGSPQHTSCCVTYRSISVFKASTNTRTTRDQSASGLLHHSKTLHSSKISLVSICASSPTTTSMSQYYAYDSCQQVSVSWNESNHVQV